jgi:phenylalanine-4-hydroxylase
VFGLADTRERVPPHLRRFVVEQDYAAYTAVDHAVWRFVLLQMYDRLQRTAHPAYARGLAATGMTVERIPRIAEMDRCLAELGWGAVCVDGFIPPRAFQEFQSLGILPIAAEIRRVEHLPYTPAPDIIHEAAGHAPILPDPEFAAFLRRIGEHGVRAFASRRDAELYDVVYALSVVKEQRDATPQQVADAERALAELVAEPSEPSEAAQLSRLYWWTVEYGLVGTPQDYRLYGAGLLSSLAESHFCHDPAVRKLPLTRDCVEVDYDITRPQPQLFVAHDFAQLGEVLDRVCARFAFRKGGLAGLRVACAAGEVATLELDSGLQVIGEVAGVDCDGDQARRVQMRGACALASGGKILAGHGRAAYPGGLSLVLSGTPSAGPRAVPPAPQAGAPAVVSAGRVTSVRAGSVDGSYFPEADYSAVRAPLRGREGAAQGRLRALYERAEQRTPQRIEQLHEALEREHPDEWLLRWNLLEALSELDADAPRRERLVDELWRLEERFERRNPIAMGLRYLGYGPDGAGTRKLKAAGGARP